MNRLTLLATALLLAGCGGQPTPTAPVEPPLAGARIGAPFTLTDQNGQPFKDSQLNGRYRIMYFGYTFCPDVCPVDVQNIGAGLKSFAAKEPALAKKIVPVFVTVDPERDTPAVVKEFVANFHPDMVGLTGDPAAIAALAKSYGVFFSKGEKQPGGGYLVDHTRTTYLMDPAGKPVALLPADEGGDKVAAELARWVK